MGTTIKQVAREARVSIATVSRVFNGKGPVSETTRRRVLHVAERLHYMPHGGARSLILRRTSTVGVLLPDIHGAFFSELIRGMDRAARDGGYHLLVSGSHHDQGSLRAVVEATRGRVDGLILMAPDLDVALIARTATGSVPVVLVNTPSGQVPADSISVDNYGGAFAMTTHLAGLGHRRIAFLMGPPENFEASERLRGFGDALAARGLAPGALLPGDFSEESGERAARELISRGPLPDALFSANDSMALGALAAFRGAGIRVPDDIALSGFDDVPMTRFLSPPLSTVHVPIVELGERAVGRLLDAITTKMEHVPQQETLPTELVVRGSCGAVRGAA